MEHRKNELLWLDHPRQGVVENDSITIEAEKYTAQGQRVSCGSRNDNAPVLLHMTEKSNFRYQIKTMFDIKARFDQCGLVVHIDDNNCLRVMAEYMHENSQKLIGLVTANGVSDSVSAVIPTEQKCVYYRVIREEKLFRIEYSLDGAAYEVMLETQMQQADGVVRIGAYVCSPAEHNFRATFSEMEFTAS